MKIRDITSVVTTISAFSPIEFYYIHPDDRVYVCAEVNSFFNYFLTALKCKKLNPPSRRSLCGLSMQKIDWIKSAYQLKIPIQPFEMKNGKYDYPDQGTQVEVIACTMIEDRIVESDTHPYLHFYMTLLAREFSMPYIRGYFSTSDHQHFHLLEISCIPDISSPQNREAILQYLNT